MILDFRFSILDFGGAAASVLELRLRLPSPINFFATSSEQDVRSRACTADRVLQWFEIENRESKIENSP
jgi:hypothetical protein